MYEKEMKSPTNAEIFIKPIHWHISTLFIPTLKKIAKTLANSKIMRTFAPVFEKHLLNTTKDGPFVYRLGRKIFILERGVRFSHGLPKKGYPRNRVTLFLFGKISLSLPESIYK